MATPPGPPPGDVGPGRPPPRAPGNVGPGRPPPPQASRWVGLARSPKRGKAPTTPSDDDDAEGNYNQKKETEDRMRRAEELRKKHARMADPLQRLKKLKELYEADLISEEEFKAKRIEILGDI